MCKQALVGAESSFHWVFVELCFPSAEVGACAQAPSNARTGRQHRTARLFSAPIGELNKGLQVMWHVSARPSVLVSGFRRKSVSGCARRLLVRPPRYFPVAPAVARCAHLLPAP